jgi:hypothetical protein
MELPPDEFGDMILPRFCEDASVLHQAGVEVSIVSRLELDEIGSPSHGVRVRPDGARLEWLWLLRTMSQTAIWCSTCGSNRLNLKCWCGGIRLAAAALPRSCHRQVSESLPKRHGAWRFCSTGRAQ